MLWSTSFKFNLHLPNTLESVISDIYSGWHWGVPTFNHIKIPLRGNTARSNILSASSVSLKWICQFWSVLFNGLILLVYSQRKQVFFLAVCAISVYLLYITLPFLEVMPLELLMETKIKYLISIIVLTRFKFNLQK